MYFLFEVFHGYSGSDLADYQRFQIKKKKNFKDNLQIIWGLNIIPFPLGWHNIT